MMSDALGDGGKRPECSAGGSTPENIIRADSRLEGRTTVGHPVDVASGVVFTAAHDFDLPGTMRLLWRRTYAADSAARTVLGPCWTAVFLMTLEVREDGWLLIADNGSAILFERPEQPLEVGRKLLNAGAHMELWRRPDGYTIVHWHHGEADLEVWNFSGVQDVLPLTSIENAAGHRFSITHDAAGRIARVTQEMENRRLVFTHDTRGLLAAIKLEHHGGAATLVRYTYDASGMLESATDAMGAITRYAYDGEGRMVLEQNPLGSAFHFRYDREGRCVETSGGGGQNYRKLKFQAGGRLTEVTDGFGHVRRFVLNAAGQVLQQISPGGVVSTTEYDAAGRIARQIHSDGTFRGYEYDVEGNRVAMTFEDGTTVRMQYNDRHALIAYTDALGATWQLQRDERNQLLGVVNPLGNRFASPRNERGFVSETISPLGRRTWRLYGPDLSWFEVWDDLGLRDRYEFDGFGNLVTHHDAEGLRSTVRYDLCNRPVEARDAFGRTWAWRYNALGEVTEYVSAAGVVERIEYDEFGQVTAHHTPLGVMHLAYDKEGRLTEVVNRKGERYTRDYDPDWRIVREVFFDGREQCYEWDNRNRMVGVERGDGSRIEYRHSVVGEVVSIKAEPGVDHSYAYDARGFMTAATAPGSRLEFGFDKAARLVSEVQNGHTIETHFDADNFRVLRHVLGAEFGFAYDSRGRLTQISDAEGPFQELHWNAIDQLERRATTEGVVERLTWRGDDRILTQTVTAAHIVRVSRRYAYDQAGYIAASDDSGAGALRYDYDAIGRLVSVHGEAGHREHYAYDAIGAITATHRGPRELGPNGRTRRDGLTRLSYDELGRLVYTHHPEHGERRYEYDARGQLRRATLADGTAVEYTYDALWRRCARRAGDRTTAYVYAGAVLVGEHDSARGGRQFAGLEWYTLAEWQDGARRFVVPDVSNTPREVFDSRGDVVWSGAFEAFGRPRQEQQAGSADRQRFPGQYSDSVTGLADNFYRVYDPCLGSYLTPDPIGLEGGADHYGYPRNPFFWFDPFGLKCAAHKAEDEMDAHFDNKGYDKIGPKPPKNLNTPGIDGVYRARPGFGPPQYIIGEAKSSQSGRLGTTIYSGGQMSDKWVNTGVGGGSPDRLTAAVGAKDAGAIRSSVTADPSSVQKAAFHQPGGTGTPTVTTKPYDPTSTTNDKF